MNFSSVLPKGPNQDHIIGALFEIDPIKILIDLVERFNFSPVYLEIADSFLALCAALIFV
jgi:hypothetical protein